ncbi:hypothetical protein [Wolbachia endosymbiont (group A) of Pipizella viduata]|uniref:hypothetical protein n=1 Tax=Wolbachia endosymbiont (group A) of Pipizella viduata TaxID=3066154 RepID=UPI00333F2C73
MSNVNEMNQELVRAFNISLCYNSIAITNLTVQNLHGKDHIVVSFDKNMDSKQCMKYLNNVKEKIIKRSYRDEKAAGVSYNLKFFPFAFNTKHLPRDDKGRKKFSVEIDEGVVFNLKCYLVQALTRDIIEKMGSKFGVERIKKSIYDTNFDRDSYLYCMLFHDKGLQKDFVDSFSAQIRRYGNAPSDYLEENGNLVYIKKSIFNDVEFIKDTEAYNASLICRHFQTPSAKSKAVDKLKYTIVNFMDKVASIPVRTIIRTSYKGSNEDSVLIPIVAKNAKDNRLFDDNDAYKINSAFNMEILSDVSESISVRLPKSDSSDSIIYGIDFSDLDIACCVLNKIMESSVINKDHELSIDPELHFRALSPPKTPPNQRKADTDSGYDSNSPPKPKDSGSSSGGPGPSSKISHSQVSPPRQGSILHHDVGAAEVGAAANMPAWTSASFQPMNRWSLPVFYAQSSDISVPRFQPPTQLSSSGPSSWKGAAKNVQASTIAWTQQPNRWSLPAPSAGFSSCSQSGASSWKGANPVGTNPWSQPMGHWSSQSSNLKEDCKKICEDFEEDYEKIESDSSLSKEEQELFKALLYWFNLNNYALDPLHTNFIVKNGKIASLIDDSVNVKEYLQKVIDKTKEEYRVNKKEAYDLNEFPFKFLSNCEKNQETTVVANISCGALYNLKKLFIQNHEKEVEIKIEDIDINIVEKYVKSEKDEWVNSQVREYGLCPKAAITSCYPDESELEYISIIEGKGGCWIDRIYDPLEVKSFRRERWPAKGTSKAEKMKSEDNKAEATTSGSSGYESMDCENTERNPLNRKSSSSEGSSSESSRSGSSNSSPKSGGENTGGKLQKRKVQSPVGRDSPAKRSLKSENSNSSSEEAGDSPHPGLSGSTLEQVRKHLSKTGILKW